MRHSRPRGRITRTVGAAPVGCWAPRFSQRRPPSPTTTTATTTWFPIPRTRSAEWRNTQLLGRGSSGCGRKRAGNEEFATLTARPVLRSATIDADVTNTTDVFGNTNQEILVTSDDDSNVTPPGTFRRSARCSTLRTTPSGILVNIYSDIPGAGPGGTDLISYSLDTPFGDFTIPTTFDAITASPNQ